VKIKYQQNQEKKVSIRAKNNKFASTEAMQKNAKKEEQSKIKSETKKQSDEIKLVDKIDIDKPDDENLEKLRKNNSKVENGQVPQKERKGFCTNCMII